MDKLIDTKKVKNENHLKFRTYGKRNDRRKVNCNRQA